jgi:hypothetical protein
MRRHVGLVVQPLLFVHAALQTGITDLTAVVQDTSETTLETLVATESTDADLAGAYLTTDWTPPATGEYLVIWKEGATVLSVDEVIVSEDPFGDAAEGVARYLQNDYGGAAVAAELLIFDTDQLAVDQVNLSALAGAADVYRTDTTVAFADVGSFFLAWQSNGASVAIDIIDVGNERGLRDVDIVVGVSADPDYTGNTPVTPLEDCSVLVSYTDGTPLIQKLTDARGSARFTLQEGTTYVVSKQKASTTFDTNNHRITPVDPDPNPNEPGYTSNPAGREANRWHFLAGTFAAAFDPISPLGLSELSLAYAYFVDLNGNPLQGVKVYINNGYSPTTRTVSSVVYGVVGSQIVLTSDANGYVETYLIEDQEVEVTVDGTTVRRTITVPTTDFNLLGSSVGTDDAFVIADPQMPTAIRRS